MQLKLINNMKILNIIWKDPVWSKVIAAGIITLIVWLFNLSLKIWFIIVWLLKLFLEQYVIIVIILLITVIIFQYITMRSKSEGNLGIEWLSNLNQQSFQKYLFLLWFPVNHRIRTHGIPNYESLNHVPEINELIIHRIIVLQPISLLEYDIILDKKVYDYLEELYTKENIDDHMKEIITQFKKIPFHMLFLRSNL